MNQTDAKLITESKSDNKFAAKARLLQSNYRSNKGWKYGVGPYKSSKDNYGNIIDEGETNGYNFILSETFAYARQRIKNKSAVETFDEYRLFCNMLSSMPMCFNLFHPMMLLKKKNPTLVNSIFQSLFPNLKISVVNDIKLEFIPEPISSYTNDKSAFDAFVQYTNTSDESGIIAIETKYVEPLGKNLSSDNALKESVAIQSGLFSDEGLKYIANGCNQAYRNFLLTEAYRLVNNLKHSHSIILAPTENNSSLKEISHIKQNLKEAYQHKIEFYPLEKFVQTIQSTLPAEENKWIMEFKKRYLDFLN